MSLIEPHLFLSSIVYAKDKYWLKQNKIKNILVIGNLELYFPRLFKYKQVKIEDKPENNIQQHFDECIDYIEQSLKKGENILVHCYGGQSRSVSVVTAYYMKTHKLKFEDAFKIIKSKHNRAEPNQGFKQQLIDFEQQI